MTVRDHVAWSQIFELYKGLPYLWDKDNVNYGNRSKMTDGYKLLTRVYREKLDKQASVAGVRLKMKNLRTTYYRELRKMKKAKIKGLRYNPSLWYFEDLNFLADSKSGKSVTEQVQNNNSQEYFEDTGQDNDMSENNHIEFEVAASTSQTIMTEGQKLKNQLAIDDILTNTATSSTERRQQDKTPKKDDRWEIIGKSIGYQLQDLNKNQYTIVSKLISDAIYYGRLNKLSLNSHIEIGHSDSYGNSPPQTASGQYNVLHAVDIQIDNNLRDRLKEEVFSQPDEDLNEDDLEDYS